MAAANNMGQLHTAPIKVTPFLSALVDGCIEKGMDVWSGGAEFNTIGARGVGLANVADSLAALREVVYFLRAPVEGTHCATRQSAKPTSPTLWSA